MDPLELIGSLTSPQEAQTVGSELDDGAVDQLLETLLGQENPQPATRSTDLLGSVLGEGAGGEAASRLDLSQLLGQPDLKEKLTHLLMDKFKLPEAIAATLAETLMSKISKRKPARRKPSTARRRKTTSHSKPRRKTSSQAKPRRKAGSSTSARKKSSDTPKKKTSTSTAERKTTSSTAKKKTGSQKTRSTIIEEPKLD
jgi:cobalamin biosynthesis Mg chelatase CobN